ncbi:response regulator transcription factor [Actinomycetospora corticicola]
MGSSVRSTGTPPDGGSGSYHGRMAAVARSPATGPLRVVLVDDHEMVLAGLQQMLAPFLDRVRVVGSASDVADALEVVVSMQPDLVLADVRLAGESGLDLCRRLGERAPGRRVVLLSVYDDEQYVFQALRAGAAGYLLKSIRGEELVSQLELAAAGTTVIDATMAGRVVTSAARLERDEFWPGAHLGLTHRESEVLALLVAGCSNRAIASRLVIGEETVKTHVRAVLRKLGVADRTAAVAAALREGMFR